MAKDKNLINKLMGTQTVAQIEEGDEEIVQETENPSSSQEDWLSEYEGQLTIDMYQTKDNVIIKSTIAGVKPEDIDVTIANDMVTIRGERKRDFEASSEDYFYQECYWGSFSRSVVLPVDVDIENVAADLKDGILTVILPKAAKARAKKIRVASRT
ncbi:MAG TPA: Hsp20/alpha crystallin family protein [Patescibacteria group bacterium]|jgi:HSP20 family protein|nr:Hsp20/alpha crystallin family protein [Patescibacteria group bacterium]